MASLLSVAQLVRRTAPPTEDHVPLWQRRVRLWSEAGILPTAGPSQGGGTRKQWRYSESTIYLAAVLLRLSDFGVETSILDRISEAIQRNAKGRGAFSRFWRGAIAGNRHTSYIMFTTIDQEHPFSFDTHEYGLGAFTLHEEPGLFLNLSGVFEEVKNAEDEA